MFCSYINASHSKVSITCTTTETWPLINLSQSTLSLHTLNAHLCQATLSLLCKLHTTNDTHCGRGSATILHSPPEFFPQIFWITVLLFFCLLLHVVCLCWILKLLQLWTQLSFHLVSKVSPYMQTKGEERQCPACTTNNGTVCVPTWPHYYDIVREVKSCNLIAH